MILAILVIIDSGSGLFPVQHKATTWTNADLESFGSVGTKFTQILIKIYEFSLLKDAFENFVGYSVQASMC